MSRIRALLSKELRWSERAGLIGGAVFWAIFCTAFGGLLLATGELLFGALFSIGGLVLAACAIGIRRDRSWGGYLAAATLILLYGSMVISQLDSFVGIELFWAILGIYPFVCFGIDVRRERARQLNLLKGSSRTLER